MHPSRRWRASRSRARSPRMHHASYPVFVHRPAALGSASFRPRLAATPLPFPKPSALRIPGCRTFTDIVTCHARHTRGSERSARFFAQVRSTAGLAVWWNTPRTPFTARNGILRAAPECFPFVRGARPYHFHWRTALGTGRGGLSCFNLFLTLLAFRRYRVAAPSAPRSISAFRKHIPSGFPSALVPSDAQYLREKRAGFLRKLLRTFGCLLARWALDLYEVLIAIQ